MKTLFESVDIPSSGIPSRPIAILICLILATGLVIARPARVVAAQPLVVLDSPDTAVLQQSKSLVTRAGAWQTWNDSLHLKHGQEKLPFVLYFLNGAEGRPKFTGLQVQLARKPFVKLEDFGGSDKLPVDLTGKLTLGNTPITVQGFGQSGARLVWKLVTRRPIISAAKPEHFGPSATVVLTGKNFSTEAGDMTVHVGSKPAKILSASSNQLQIQIPADVSGGSHDLSVTVHSIKSNLLRVSAKAHPQIVWVDFVATAPGQPLILSGHGFSTVPSENHVFFGTIPAQVTASNQAQITCIVPDMPFPQWHVPISVTTHGLRSKEHVSINIDQRVIPNEGIPMF